MKRLLCRIFGHKFACVGVMAGTVYLQCDRCGDDDSRPMRIRPEVRDVAEGH